MENDKLAMRNYRYSPLTRYGQLLTRKINRAINEFSLLSDDDRVCVAVSGGKDSLSLLHLLMEHKRFYNGHYPVEAVHAVSDYNPQAGETKAYLMKLFESLGIEYGFVEISVTTGRNGKKSDPTCFWCSWKRREALFKYCVEKGCNKLAFAHHSDDVAETTLLNLVYHGSLETMLPGRDFFDGAFTLIRPLFYVREKELARYAKMAGFTTVSCICPNADRGKRKVMKKLLQDLRKESRQLNANLWRAAKRW